MSDTNFAAIGQLVTEARNLLDSIKGGAIRVMQTQFDALMSTSKSQFDALVNAKKSVMDKFVSDQYGRVSSVLNDVHGELPHVLLTRNQVLEVANASSILGFSTIHCEELEVTKEATIYANPSNDTDWTGNGVAADFRASVIGDAYVNTAFNILRVKFRRGVGGHPSRIDNFYMKGKHQGAATGAALVKVISGSMVGGWPQQIVHGNGWETRGSQARVTGRGGNLNSALGHDSINLGDNNTPNDEGEFLICLYGVANGVVDFDKWGVFPEMDKSWKV